MTAHPAARGADRRPLRPEMLTLAVYAPFGTDPVLSGFPDGKTTTIADHPLVRNLAAVARTGVAVVAIVDRADDDTWLVTFAPGSAQPELSSLGKQDMQSANTLTKLLRDAHAFAPDNACVLTLEGHGAGYLPDLDPQALTLDDVTAGGALEWRLGAVGELGALSRPYDEAGQPYVASGAPVLPGGSPTSPTNHAAMPTAEVAAALAAARSAGVPKVSVVHLNNCFNMSAELLHTIMPYAEYATGYCNYNFFTAGQPYPAVFQRLAAAGSASDEQLAKWFAAENHKVLLEAGHEPTVAGTVELARMHEIAEKVDDLSDALLAALRTASPTERPAIVDKIRQAIVGAQQYDSRPDYVLEAPDELTDLDSFATELLKYDFEPYKVAPAAEALRRALCGIKQYGDVDTPWMAPGDLWDFSSKNLAMNIFLPDPLLKGLWDWRSQYYLDVNPDPRNPQVQRSIIDFVKVTDWVDFLVEYHRDTPFVGLLPALIPEYPPLRSDFNPRCPRGRREGAPR